MLTYQSKTTRKSNSPPLLLWYSKICCVCLVISEIRLPPTRSISLFRSTQVLPPWFWGFTSVNGKQERSLVFQYLQVKVLWISEPRGLRLKTLCRGHLSHNHSANAHSSIKKAKTGKECRLWVRKERQTLLTRVGAVKNWTDRAVTDTARSWSSSIKSLCNCW